MMSSANERWSQTWPKHADAGAVTVLIACGYQPARPGWCAMLRTSPDVRIVAEAADEFEAIALVADLRPRAVVMPTDLSPGDGFAAACAIRRISPATSILLLGLAGDSSGVRKAVRAGASGYLPLQSTGALVLHAVLAIAQGDVLVAGTSYLPLAPVTALAAPCSGAGRSPSSSAEHTVEPLTERDVTILELIAQGMTNRDMARTLSFAEVTINMHVRRILARLRAADRTQAAVIALRLGIIV